MVTFCNHVVLMKLCCIENLSPASQIISCHAEFGLALANEVMLWSIPHLSALLRHVLTDEDSEDSDSLFYRLRPA